MLDPNSTGQQTQTQTTPPAGAGAGDAGDAGVPTEQFVNDLLSSAGTPPGVSEGMDETQQLILENQFRQDVRQRYNDEKEIIMEAYPDASRGDVQKFIAARGKDDVVGMMQALEAIVKKAAEKQQNTKEQEDLRVEGANAGSKGDEEAPINSVADSMAAILSKVNAAAAA